MDTKKYTKTDTKVTNGNRKAVVYAGQRGGKYIKQNGAYVGLTKTQKSELEGGGVVTGVKSKLGLKLKLKEKLNKCKINAKDKKIITKLYESVKDDFDLEEPQLKSICIKYINNDLQTQTDIIIPYKILLYFYLKFYLNLDIKLNSIDDNKLISDKLPPNIRDTDMYTHMINEYIYNLRLINYIIMYKLSKICTINNFNVCELSNLTDSQTIEPMRSLLQKYNEWLEEWKRDAEAQRKGEERTAKKYAEFVESNGLDKQNPGMY